MATVIRDGVARERIPSIFYSIFPPSFIGCLSPVFSHGGTVDEVRLRVGRQASLSFADGNLMLDYVFSQQQMDEVFSRICDGSLYAHAHTIINGYVTLAGGIRVGVVGRAAMDKGEVIGVYDVSSLCFRLPHKIRSVGAPIVRLLRESEGDGGVLVYSPPAQGKTTLLGSVARELSSGVSPLRVAVMDTRGELGYSLDGHGLCLDILSGYPRPLGIEIAARTMNAQLMICDEIGAEDEARAIIAVQNCGVPLLATAHASALEGLLQRTGIRLLHDAGVFSHYVGIRRVSGERDYQYTIDTWGEADAYLQNSGSDTADVLLYDRGVYAQ